MTSRPAAECIFKEAMNLPFFHLEDVFLTGFAAENCGINKIHTETFHPLPVKTKEGHAIVNVQKTDILWHYMDTRSLVEMHKCYKEMEDKNMTNIMCKLF